MSEQRRIVMDLDGTLCEQVDTRSSEKGVHAYAFAAPMVDVIERVNRLYDKGWHVTIFTARGMRTFNGNIHAVVRALWTLTDTWLKENGVKYHELRFGKPPGDVYVDDRGMRPDEFLER